ncbi:MAG: DUF1146 family protein [Bacilli bacterium]
MLPDLSVDLSIGVNGLLNILLSLFFIGITWWTLQAFRYDFFVKNVQPFQVKLLMIFISIAIGHSVAGFFIDYLSWSTMLVKLF